MLESCFASCASHEVLNVTAGELVVSLELCLRVSVTVNLVGTDKLILDLFSLI